MRRSRRVEGLFGSRPAVAMTALDVARITRSTIGGVLPTLYRLVEDGELESWFEDGQKFYRVVDR